MRVRCAAPGQFQLFPCHAHFKLNSILTWYHGYNRGKKTNQRSGTIIVYEQS